MKTFRTQLLASAVMAAALIGAPAYAQTAAADAQQPTDAGPRPAESESTATGDIVVTGSRIVSPNLISSSPVTVVNAQDVKLQGATRLEDVLNNLPQAFATQASSVSNGSTGTATLNLRNLGDQRTLVLVNGRRLMPGDPVSKSSAADINVLPGIMIKRIDVLTGGASSTYGSDAVGGVVNFVLDNDFSGVSLDANYGIFNHNNNNDRFRNLVRNSGYPAPRGMTTDGRNFDVSLKVGAGTDDGRGHIVGYLGYRSIAAVDQGSRDYSACGLGTSSGSEYVCSGSATAFPANFTLTDGTRDGPPTQYTLNAAGQLVPGRTLYNANPLNYFQRPDTRYTGGFMAHYDVSEAFKPYAEFMFMDDRSVAQIAPSGNFSNTSTLNCGNPFLSAVQVATFCRASNLTGSQTTNPDGTVSDIANVFIGRRNVEGGGRQADITHTSYRFVAGARGDIAKGVSYDVFGQYGTTKYSLIYKNEFSVSRTGRALDAVRNAQGQIVCRSVIDGSDPNCVPLNIFGSAAITPEALNYVQISGLQQGQTKETVVNGSITFQGGEYGIKSPFADEGFGLNIGGEYRKEQLELNVDTSFATGDLAGQGGPTLPVAGDYNVKEFFAEVQLPLVADRPFFHELTLNAGYRYSDYNLSGGVSSYKGAATWAPVRDITLRGSYNRAVRAPNIQELFQSQSVQIDGSTDPCAGTSPTATAAQCVNLGVPTSRYGLIPDNPSAQYNGLLGGNLNLRPETADTFTAGVILRPSFLPGFNLTVDAFSIKVKDIISVIGADTILAQCAATGDATLCGLINRDANGSLWQSPNGFVVDTNLNSGSLKTRGIDINAGYTYQLAEAGSLSASFSGTYVDEYTYEKVGVSFDCSGYYGGQCGQPQAKWRHQLRLTWQGSDGIGLSGRWRYIDPTRFERTSDNPALAGSSFALDRRIPSQSYFDLTMTARVQDRYTFRIGANNLLDREPPSLSQTAAPIGSFGNGNTYPGIYEPLGRYIFAGLTIDM
ncbi:TonB-dependent receptor [Sphingomonas sp. BK235]|uniref:TonB-dependent receptor domain-containing protein n=1 Tax=Sphingomonas sp. BK235 TaxID=2512131 RepID=UPI0010507DB9|nr:TonB-dependent receptor [Sphingomonas sp. BK235]TCP33357.1 TonB-dependent receptor-like protein [Sphingomonas sp. BK235]